jgi:hypothetical protein
MPLLTRTRVILAKTETTYGTDSTPTGAANAILVRNLEITPLDSEVVSRDILRSYLGNYEQLIASSKVSVTFEVECAGSGTAGTAPGYKPLLLACGMAETVVASTSVTYAPVSSAFSSVTIYVQMKLDAGGSTNPTHKITGCRGNVEWVFNSKSIPVMRYTFTGIYQPVTDAAAIAGTYTAFKTPQVVNDTNTTAFSILGYSGAMSEFSLNMNNEVVHRELVNSTSVLIVDRKVSGTAVFEAPTITAKNFFTAALDSASLGNLSLVHGTAAGNILTMTGTSTVDIGNPTFTESDGIVMMSCPFVLVPTTAGNDEFSFVNT